MRGAQQQQQPAAAALLEEVERLREENSELLEAVSAARVRDACESGERLLH
jgi:hypothetical protein